jgi:hypothetical protein
VDLVEPSRAPFYSSNGAPWRCSGRWRRSGRERTTRANWIQGQRKVSYHPIGGEASPRAEWPLEPEVIEKRAGRTRSTYRSQNETQAAKRPRKPAAAPHGPPARNEVHVGCGFAFARSKQACTRLDWIDSDACMSVGGISSFALHAFASVQFPLMRGAA